MSINFLALLVVALGEQAASVPLEIPRLPTYTSTETINCGSHKYSVSIRNQGFTSHLVSSQSNGKSVLFKTANGENMADVIAKMHSVSVQPSGCQANDAVGLSIRGVNMRAQSKTYGTETIVFVSSAPVD